MGYRRVLAFLSYLFGFIALIAVLVDYKKDKLYSFHVWQAFFLNVCLAMVNVLYFGIYLPQKMLMIEVASRPDFLLKSLFIPLSIVIIILLEFAILAYQERYVKIPLIGDLAKKLSKYGGKNG